MIKEKLDKLKKYLFFISLLFLISTFGHIFYSFVYFDSKSIPVKGGTISEGIVGDTPHLNPLISTTDYNKYVVNILYRSLLKYDIGEKKIVGDLVNCDISNLSYIECFLENNSYWSNGEKITTKDIISTYKIFQTTDTNLVLKSLLGNTKIEETGNSIIFKNPSKDINFLNIFFQPILPEKVINSLGIDDLTKPFIPSLESIYSGKYKVSSLKEDKDLGITELTLLKNDKYQNNSVYIDKIILKFFKNSTFLLRNKDIVNIFNDDENIIGKSVPRLSPNYYTLPKYNALFINEDKITSKSLRNFILNKIDRSKLISLLGENRYKEAKNPYLTEYSIDKPLENKNIESLMESIGYHKKPELAHLILGEEKVNSTQTGTLAVLTQSDEDKLKEVEEKNNIQLNYITSGLSNKYNFVSSDDILLKGDTKGENPDSIYINDYPLKGYKSGNNYFYYRLKEESYETIKEGKNIYNIYFEIKGKKYLKDELIVFYNKDELSLSKQKESFYKGLLGITQNNSNIEVKTTKKESLDPKIKEKLDSIDDKYFYNKKIEKFSLVLMYIGGEDNTIKTAEFIRDTLGEYGIDVQLKQLTLSDLSKVIGSGNSTASYDMMLAGINLGYFDYNIFPYFHSGQAKLGYNFSNIKKLSLDMILEEIKSNKFTKDKVKDIENQALSIIKEEQVVKTLYTPVMNLLVDKNIKNFTGIESIPNVINRFDYINKIYVNDKKEINYSTKTFLGFIKFIYKIIVS